MPCMPTTVMCGQMNVVQKFIVAVHVLTHTCTTWRILPIMYFTCCRTSPILQKYTYTRNNNSKYIVINVSGIFGSSLHAFPLPFVYFHVCSEPVSPSVHTLYNSKLCTIILAPTIVCSLILAKIIYNIYNIWM